MSTKDCGQHLQATAAFAKDLMGASCYNLFVLTGANAMIAPLTCGKCQLNGLVIALAVTLPILIVPHEASAKGGISFHLAPKAETATLPSPRTPTDPLGGGGGGKRYRDPTPQRCRGPADFGH